MEKTSIKKARSGSFSKVYSTNVLVSETDSDVRLYGFNEIINADNGEKIAVSDGEFILTYQATVLLYEQLKDLITKWEPIEGKIEVSESRRKILEELLEDF